MKTGIELITEERQRQIDVEGWTTEHDDIEHANSELAIAGACYALPNSLRKLYKDDEGFEPGFWPWDEGWWKPTPEDRVRELQKAGALITAEIDRLQRLNH